MGYGFVPRRVPYSAPYALRPGFLWVTILNMWISCYPPLHLSHLGAKKKPPDRPQQTKQRQEIVFFPPWQP